MHGEKQISYIMQHNFQQILSRFGIAETDVAPFGDGLINATYRVCNAQGEPKYILQRINHFVFKDVEALQRNIQAVTGHIRQKLTTAKVTDIGRKVLALVPALDEKLYYFDGENYWRIYDFIADSITLTRLTPRSARLSGGTFGDFQYMLSDLPEGTIVESIPGFHNMPLRLSQMEQALKDDTAGRAKEVAHITTELERRKEAYCIQETLYKEGKLPKRINHCDTKLNNILFDKNETPLCVVDLDTVMPGFVLSDIGDFVRIGGNEAPEDEADLSKIKLNKEVIMGYADGYMSKAARFLIRIEAELLAYGPALMAYMQTVRFFTDYLNGDTYYKTVHPLHNLQRTHAQFRLLQLLEAEQKGLQSELLALYEKYRG